MSVYLLDTSIIVDLLRQKKEVADFISTHFDDVFITSCICEAEILVGVYRGEQKEISARKEQVRRLFAAFYETVPFDSFQADLAAEIWADLSKKGQLIDDLDILIAAAALANRAVLLTKNLKHFQRIQNLSIESL